MIQGYHGPLVCYISTTLLIINKCIDNWSYFFSGGDKKRENILGLPDAVQEQTLRKCHRMFSIVILISLASVPFMYMGNYYILGKAAG